MKYIAINFNTTETVVKGITKLVEAGYLFTNANHKRMTDLHEILGQITVIPSSILLGDAFCKMEWNIYERNSFCADRNYEVMSVDAFLGFYTDFLPYSYKRTYEQ